MRHQTPRNELAWATDQTLLVLRVACCWQAMQADDTRDAYYSMCTLPAAVLRMQFKLIQRGQHQKTRSQEQKRRQEQSLMVPYNDKVILAYPNINAATLLCLSRSGRCTADAAGFPTAVS